MYEEVDQAAGKGGMWGRRGRTGGNAHRADRQQVSQDSKELAVVTLGAVQHHLHRHQTVNVS